MVANLNTTVIYCRLLTLVSVATAVNYCKIFVTLAPVVYPCVTFSSLMRRQN